VIFFWSPAVGVVVARAVGAPGWVAAVASCGVVGIVVGIVASIPGVLMTICPFVPLVAGQVALVLDVLVISVLVLIVSTTGIGTA